MLHVRSNTTATEPVEIRELSLGEQEMVSGGGDGDIVNWFRKLAQCFYTSEGDTAIPSAGFLGAAAAIAGAGKNH